MIYLISEKYNGGYRGSPFPIGYVKTVKELTAFLKRRGYYVRSHAQSTKVVKEELNKAGYCTLYKCTGKRFKMSVGSFEEIKQL